MLEHNHIPEMVSEVVRGKALASIVESATVTDASGNHVELKNLQPDGTIADPAELAEAAAARAEAAADEADADGHRRRREGRRLTAPRLSVRPVSHAVTRVVDIPGVLCRH